MSDGSTASERKRSISIIPSLLAADFRNLEKTLQELDPTAEELAVNRRPSTVGRQQSGNRGRGVEESRSRGVGRQPSAVSSLETGGEKLESQPSTVDRPSWIHLDIMDGHFVPNLTFGPFLVKQIRSCTARRLEAHLMITHPLSYVDAFLDAGVDRVIPHIETFEISPGAGDRGQGAGIGLSRERGGSGQEGIPAVQGLSSFQTLVYKARKKGVEVGLALNPETEIDVLEPYLSDLDLVLLMTVSPGFCAQTLDERVLPKIGRLRSMGWNKDLAVDGGVTLNNFEALLERGANLLVCGSALFGSGTPRETLRQFEEKAFRYSTQDFS